MKRSESIGSGVSAGAGHPDGGYTVRYADPGYAQLGRIVEREKHCPTRSAVLSFCAILLQLGGEPIEVVQQTPGPA